MQEEPVSVETPPEPLPATSSPLAPKKEGKGRSFLWGILLLLVCGAIGWAIGGLAGSEGGGEVGLVIGVAVACLGITGWLSQCSS